MRSALPKGLSRRLSTATGASDQTYNAFIHNAFIHKANAPTLQEQQGDLTGLSVAVKDMFCTKHAPTTCASRMLKDFQAPYDATVVSLLRQHGATIIGKTNMDEFGMGSQNVHSHYGPVRNPANPSAPDQRVAGGSSGGSAAAVATGLCDLALASDTGGSTRLPAAYCGIYGLKPSYGLLSRFGMVAYASSLDTVGLMSKKLDHLQTLFDVLNVADDKDPTSIGEEFRLREKEQATHGDLSTVRVGVSLDFLPEELSQEVLQNFKSAVRHLKAAGATIVPVTLPSMPECLSAYYVLSSSEASSNLARYSGMFYGHQASEGNASLVSQTRTEGFGEEVQKRILLGNFALNADAFENYFLAAQKLRQRIRTDFDVVFRQPSPLNGFDKTGSSTSGVDCLVHPAAISSAPELHLDGKVRHTAQEYMQDILNVPSSLAGIPAISVPWRDDTEGWPLGIQVAAQWGHEHILFRAARILAER